MEENVIPNLNNAEKPQRNKSIELLRIVLMLMIIASHVKAHGGIVYEKFGVNSAFLAVLGCCGNLAVNVFIVITGYYSWQSKFNYKKIIRLILEVTLYSIILNTVSLIYGNSTFSVNFVLATILPIFFGKGYWFIVRYLQLYLLIPLLNIGLKGVGQKFHLLLIVIFGIMFCAIPSLIGPFFTVQDYQYSTLIWFVWLYALGAYLGIYGSVFYRKKKLTLALLLLAILILIVAIVVKNYYSFQDDPNHLFLKGIRKVSRILGDQSRNAMLIVIISLLMFIAFQNMTIKLPNIVYPIAGSVFGVYLLHDNSEFKNILWQTICGTTRMQNSPWFPLYAIVIVILIFTVCCIIDILVRKFIFKPLYKKIKL